jgi:biopolymer transport protein ExbB
MLPIILCSIISISIIAERFWSLRREKVLPKHLVANVWNSVKQDTMTRTDIEAISRESALGTILSAGLLNRYESRERIKEGIEERGREVVHDMERFLNTLGTIASISPLLGLLGTVIGMIRVFAAITQHGVGDPGALAGGISEAMITTAAGLTVAIISLVFYRYFRRKVDGIVVIMEREAIKMVDVLHNNRKRGSQSATKSTGMAGTDLAASDQAADKLAEAKSEPAS